MRRTGNENEQEPAAETKDAVCRSNCSVYAFTWQVRPAGEAGVQPRVAADAAGQSSDSPRRAEHVALSVAGRRPVLNGGADSA